MNAQTIISHRMFVAALSHDASQGGRQRGAGAAPPAALQRDARAGNLAMPEPTGAVAQQLSLLADGAEFQPARA